MQYNLTAIVDFSVCAKYVFSDHSDIKVKLIS